MKISTKGRYALRMLLDLAEHETNNYIALKDIIVFSYRSGYASFHFSRLSVIASGQTTLTLIPNCPHSAAAVNNAQVSKSGVMLADHTKEDFDLAIYSGL